MRKLGSHLESMADHHDLAMHHLGKAEAGSGSTASSTSDASLNPKEGSEVSPVTRESITIHPQVTMTEGHVAGSTYSGRWRFPVLGCCCRRCGEEGRGCGNGTGAGEAEQGH